MFLKHSPFNWIVLNLLLIERRFSFLSLKKSNVHFFDTFNLIFFFNETKKFLFINYQFKFFRISIDFCLWQRKIRFSCLFPHSHDKTTNNFIIIPHFFFFPIFFSNFFLWILAQFFFFITLFVFLKDNNYLQCSNFWEQKTNIHVLFIQNNFSKYPTFKYYLIILQKKMLVI